MRITAGAMLAALAFALPAVAQTQGTDTAPKKDVEKLWRIEATGIGG